MVKHNVRCFILRNRGIYFTGKVKIDNFALNLKMTKN